MYIVGTPPLLQGGGGVEPQTKFSKRGGLDRTPQLLEGGCWIGKKEGSGVFEGGELIPQCPL